MSTRASKVSSQSFRSMAATSVRSSITASPYRAS